ncbi:MAG: nucleotidyltransferase domain-containing protein [Candidatus Kapabacteria bacterium]|jgi:predicted nucleotidyltransferase|nr:nucleotidyltransferase domain-containing protein [Candidatus Kapabacteria bacterium]
MPESLNTDFLRRIRDTVQAVETSAECILFGSRARGDAREDSDWDVLVLVDGEVTEAQKRRIRYALYDLEFEIGAVLSSIIKSKERWRNESIVYNTWLSQNVAEEGILL